MAKRKEWEEWTMNVGPTYCIDEKPKSKHQMHKLK